MSGRSDRWMRVAIAVLIALLVALALTPFPSDRAAREGRLRCDIPTQTCSTHHERTP